MSNRAFLVETANELIILKLYTDKKLIKSLLLKIQKAFCSIIKRNLRSDFSQREKLPIFMKNIIYDMAHITQLIDHRADIGDY